MNWKHFALYALAGIVGVAIAVRIPGLGPLVIPPAAK